MDEPVMTAESSFSLDDGTYKGEWCNERNGDGGRSPRVDAMVSDPDVLALAAQEIDMLLENDQRFAAILPAIKEAFQGWLLCCEGDLPYWVGAEACAIAAAWAAEGVASVLLELVEDQALVLPESAHEPVPPPGLREQAAALIRVLPQDISLANQIAWHATRVDLMTIFYKEQLAAGAVSLEHAVTELDGMDAILLSLRELAMLKGIPCPVHGLPATQGGAHAPR